jgi:hypothetical protein
MVIEVIADGVLPSGRPNNQSDTQARSSIPEWPSAVR